MLSNSPEQHLWLTLSVWMQVVQFINSVAYLCERSVNQPVAVDENGFPSVAANKEALNRNGVSQTRRNKQCIFFLTGTVIFLSTFKRHTNAYVKRKYKSPKLFYGLKKE